MNMQPASKSYLPWLILAALLAALPLVVTSPYMISMMVFVALYGVLAIGMGILMGQAGLFSLIQPTWFGLGAYIAGVLSVRELASPAMSILIAAAVVAVLAVIIGASVLRLRGLYLACATFGILVVAQIAFVQLDDLTGGHSGLLGVPSLKIAGFRLKGDLHYYYLSWALCLGCLLFGSNVINSRVGRAVISSHDNETASSSLGVNTAKYRLQIFVLTAVMASLAGSVFCYYLQFASPDIFGFELLVELVLMTVIGGVARVWAPLLGCFVITWLREILKAYLGEVFPVMTGEVTAVFFGVFIILVLIFLPQGMAGWLESVASRLRRRGAPAPGEGS